MSERTVKSTKSGPAKNTAAKATAAADRPKSATARPAASVEEAVPAAMKRQSTPRPTDTDSEEEAPAKPAVAEPAALPQPRGLDSSTITKIWLGAVGVTIVLTILLGNVYGRATGVLVLVTAAFCAVIALFWSSLRTLLGETVLQSADAFAIGAHGGEDEQKRAVLRALKDLEFERGVGKISEADYRILVAKLRARAKDLLRQLDEEGAEKRRLAEKIVEGRVATIVGKAAPADQDDEEDGTEAAAETAAETDESNDDDHDDEAKNDGLSAKSETSSNAKDDDDDDDEPAVEESKRMKEKRS